MSQDHNSDSESGQPKTEYFSEAQSPTYEIKSRETPPVAPKEVDENEEECLNFVVDDDFEKVKD